MAFSLAAELGSTTPARCGEVTRPVEAEAADAPRFDLFQWQRLPRCGGSSVHALSLLAPPWLALLTERRKNFADLPHISIKQQAT